MAVKNDFKPQGYLTMSNFGGIEIEINNANDAVRYKLRCDWYNYGSNSRCRWQKIKFNRKGEAYFCIRRIRCYLNEFMRF